MSKKPKPLEIRPFSDVTVPDEFALGYVPKTKLYVLSFRIGDKVKSYALDENTLAGMCEAFARLILNKEDLDAPRKNCANCN